MQYTLLALIIALTPLQAFAQEFAYSRSINVSQVTAETPVWVPLDAHGMQKMIAAYGITDSSGEHVAFKTHDSRRNLLLNATIDKAPHAAETIPKTTLDALMDSNAETYFQPETATTQVFRFHYADPVAPKLLSFQLQSGSIYDLKVRSGTSFSTLKDRFSGTHFGTWVSLSGERATHYEISFKTLGVVQITEASLISPEKSLLFLAQPNETYTLYYGNIKDENAVDNAEVYTNDDAITANLGSAKTLSDGSDEDNDAIPDALDNCRNAPNTDQRDRDGDGLGDACDNAPLVSNNLQDDRDEDGIGDGQDNCPDHKNSDQKDVDLDGIGWACDDSDSDSIVNSLDNCVGVSNRDQRDLDNNNVGDLCQDDRDGDGIPRTEDNCSTTFNPDQSDTDTDGIGDTCDVCPEHFDPNQIDRDQDGTGDVCQNIMEDVSKDIDNDGVPDNQDVCKHIANPEQEDTDGDGVGNRCDNCPNLKNTNQYDRDSNGVGDVCTDTDRDGVLDSYDNCPTYANADQKDSNENGTGNPCDDDDKDRIENGRDNCPFDRNPLQEDADKDDVGNVCDDSDDRWSEQFPWLLWGSMGGIVILMGLIGASILKKSEGQQGLYVDEN